MKNFYLILGLFSALLITSCNKDSEIIPPPAFLTDNVIVRTNITENTTWLEIVYINFQEELLLQVELH